MLTQLKKKEVLVAGVAGLVVGLLLGWLVIGWWLWPVKWVDADPWDLRAEHKQAYVAMVADSLATNGDSDLAQQRLRHWDRQELSKILQTLIEDRRARQMGLEAQNLEMLRATLGLEAQAPAPAPAQPAPQPAAKPVSGLVRWLPLILGILVILLLALAAIGWLTRRQKGTTPRRPAPPREAPTSPDGTTRLNSFLATYRFGEASYDESFSIESPDGEFLGECGMGISETLTEGTPNRVTALEIWLFDKTDIRTVTKVLMSEWAHGDADMRAVLAPKGELLLAAPGQEIIMETDRLRLKATIAEVSYGSEQPPNSYFERLAVRMEPSLKPCSEATAG